MVFTIVRSPVFVWVTVIAGPIAGLLLGAGPVPIFFSVVLLVATSIGLSIRHAHRNARQWSEREPQFDRSFLIACGVDPTNRQARAALAIRAGIADLATVPPETIHAADRIRGEIDTLPYWDSIDMVGFVVALEERLGEPVPDDLGGVVLEAYKEPELDVREFVRRVLSRLDAESA